MCTYLHQRQSIYYFRRAIPAELRPALGGKVEFMVSLRTKDRAEAKRKIPALTIKTNGLLDEARAAFPHIRPERPAERVFQAHAAYEAEMMKNSLEAAEIAYQEMNARENRRADRSPIRRKFESIVGKTTMELTAEEATIRDMLRDLTHDLTVAQEHAAIRAIGQAERRRGWHVSVLPVDARPGGESAVPLLATFDAYAAEQSIKPITAREWRAIIQKLIAFVGHDDAAKLTIEDMDRWRDGLLAETTKRAGSRSPRTVKDKYFGAIRATLNWAVEKRKLDENVAAKVVVRVPRKAKLRDPDFTADEVKAILSATLQAPPESLAPERALARRSIPWICAYTGARVNEISQLRGQDVRQIDGVWTIRITPEAGTVKANAARTVPLHPHLVEQGFPIVAASAGDGPLFYNPGRQRVQGPGNRHFKKVGERLAEWVRDEVGITDPSVQPNHGWRHTFKTRAAQAGISERVADAIQGHAPTTVSRSYGSTPLAVMADAIAKLPRFSVD